MVGGDMESQGYSIVLEGVFRVVFNREELALSLLRPVRGDRVVFANYIGSGQDMAIELDARDDYDGPIDEKWSVASFSSVVVADATMMGGAGTMEVVSE
jgi:hypothetical protein